MHDPSHYSRTQSPYSSAESDVGRSRHWQGMFLRNKRQKQPPRRGQRQPRNRSNQQTSVTSFRGGIGEAPTASTGPATSPMQLVALTSCKKSRTRARGRWDGGLAYRGFTLSGCRTATASSKCRAQSGRVGCVGWKWDVASRSEETASDILCKRSEVIGRSGAGVVLPRPRVG